MRGGRLETGVGTERRMEGGTEISGGFGVGKRNRYGEGYVEGGG